MNILKIKSTITNHNEVMKTDAISRNKRSLRRQMSRKNQLSMKINSIILMAVVLLLSGCASIVTKSTYPVSINSHPSNAKIIITNKHGNEIYSGNTPATVRLEAGSGFFSRAEYSVKFSTPGYEDKIVPITFKLDGWYFGNIFFGGAIGMLIVDPATGAMWKIETEFLNETLNKTTTASLDPEMKLLNINDIPDDWKTHLVKVN